MTEHEKEKILVGDLAYEEIISTLPRWEEQDKIVELAPEEISRLSEVGRKIDVVCYLGTWCPDSRGAVPHYTRALEIAEAMGWQDHRRAFAHYANGRLLLSSDPKAAQTHFRAADQFYAATPGATLHRAYVATQLAAYAITRGDGDAARRIHGVRGERKSVG